MISKGKQLRKSAVRETEETAGGYSAMILVLEQGPLSNPAADVSVPKAGAWEEQETGESPACWPSTLTTLPSHPSYFLITFVALSSQGDTESQVKSLMTDSHI